MQNKEYSLEGNALIHEGRISDLPGPLGKTSSATDLKDLIESLKRAQLILETFVKLQG